MISLRKPISSYHPMFYFLSVHIRTLLRSAKQLFGRTVFAKHRQNEPLPYRVYKHQSVLIRRLGDVDLTLQENKVVNIKLVLGNINGILIQPGETFSFCKLSGKLTAKKGYLNGMLLANGEAREGVGGGICQIANLIHWLCLHSPLTITEHHHHGFDPFPDSGRVVPFGCGASIFYNYIDYQFRNDTKDTYQLLFWMDEKCLHGDLRISSALPYKFHIVEKNHLFLCYENDYYRTNEIWRTKNMKIGSGEIIEEVLLQKNFSLTKYIPEEYTLVSSAEELAEYRQKSVQWD